MENTVEKMKVEFEAFLKDNEKFEKGNATAGTRARKALAELTKLAKTRRGEITAEKHARKEAK